MAYSGPYFLQEAFLNTSSSWGFLSFLSSYAINSWKYSLETQLLAGFMLLLFISLISVNLLWPETYTCSLLYPQLLSPLPSPHTHPRQRLRDLAGRVDMNTKMYDKG